MKPYCHSWKSIWGFLVALEIFFQLLGELACLLTCYKAKLLTDGGGGKGGVAVVLNVRRILKYLSLVPPFLVNK